MDMRINAMKETFELVTVLGKPALFTQFRVDRDTVPENLYVYDIRHDDDQNGCPCEISPNILVNYLGTIIVKEPIEMDSLGSKILNVSEEYLDKDTQISMGMEYMMVCDDFNYAPGDELTIEEFISRH